MSQWKSQSEIVGEWVSEGGRDLRNCFYRDGIGIKFSDQSNEYHNISVKTITNERMLLD